MTAPHASRYAAAALAAGLAFGITTRAQQPAVESADPQPRAQPAGERQGGHMSVEQATTSWKAGPKKAAKMMQEKYGPPSGVTPHRLVWTDKQPWKEIILLNEEIAHDFPVPHKDYLEHVIELKVPAERVGELAKFDGSIIVDRTRGTISARCDTEPHNLLALNLAYDILHNKKDVEAARTAYAEIAKKEMQGEKHDYLSKLSFQPMPNSGDSDVALMQKPGGPAPTGEPQPAGERQAGETQQEQRQSGQGTR